MDASNNVFRGATSVADYFDPDRNPPLPLVEIPNRLNPYRTDGVRIYAKMLTCLPAQNVKSLPALKMLRGIPEARDKEIVEASSGSTALSLGITARVLWGHGNVNAYVTNKKHPESLNLIRFFGITPHLYGGLAQQEPTDESGIMCRLRRLVAKRNDMIYPGQYDNENNWKAHEQWTGPQILKQLPEINVFCTTVGTGGCITGTASHLKSAKPTCRILGVFNVFGDATPGPRHFEGFNSCGFPWGQNVDTFVDVASALQGLLDYIGQLRRERTLGELADEATGEISCVFTCSDLPYQYLPQYFQKLGEDEFPPIENKILLKCDQLRHDERWILEPLKAVEMLQSKPVSVPGKADANVSLTSLDSDATANQKASTVVPTIWSTFRACLGGLVGRVSPNSVLRQPKCCTTHLVSADVSTPFVIDLRSKATFRTHHFPGSLNLPLDGLTPELANGDLFRDADAVFMVWNAMQSLFSRSHMSKMLAGAKRSRRPVLVLCYDGDACRLGSAILRNQGVEAFTIKKGFEGLRDVMGS